MHARPEKAFTSSGGACRTTSTRRGGPPSQVGGGNGVAAQPEVAHVVRVAQRGVQVEDGPAGQGLAPQQLVVDPQHLAEPVRVPAACFGPHVETRIDEKAATHVAVSV